MDGQDDQYGEVGWAKLSERNKSEKRLLAALGMTGKGLFWATQISGARGVVFANQMGFAVLSSRMGKDSPADSIEST
jgi:hypothetical protein